MNIWIARKDLMTINDQIRDEKLRYDINKKAAKISALSPGKIHKYEYLTYSPLGKAFQKAKHN